MMLEDSSSAHVTLWHVFGEALEMQQSDWAAQASHSVIGPIRPYHYNYSLICN